MKWFRKDKVVEDEVTPTVIVDELLNAEEEITDIDVYRFFRHRDNLLNIYNTLKYFGVDGIAIEFHEKYNRKTNYIRYVEDVLDYMHNDVKSHFDNYENIYNNLDVACYKKMYSYQGLFKGKTGKLVKKCFIKVRDEHYKKVGRLRKEKIKKSFESMANILKEDTDV